MDSMPTAGHSANGVVCKDDRNDVIMLHGITVPTDGGSGFAVGCLFIHTDGGAGTALYCNEGSRTSCDFDAVTVA